MRALLIVVLLAFPAPALADQASVDEYHRQHRIEIDAAVAATMKGIADQKVLCAKVGGPRIGLTSEGVRRSCWGRPSRINTTQTATGSHEQWVYGGSYVYLDNGVVTAIQSSR